MATVYRARGLTLGDRRREARGEDEGRDGCAYAVTRMMHGMYVYTCLHMPDCRCGVWVGSEEEQAEARVAWRLCLGLHGRQDWGQRSASKSWRPWANPWDSGDSGDRCDSAGVEANVATVARLSGCGAEGERARDDFIVVGACSGSRSGFQQAGVVLPQLPASTVQAAARGIHQTGQAPAASPTSFFPSLALRLPSARLTAAEARPECCLSVWTLDAGREPGLRSWNAATLRRCNAER